MTADSIPSLLFMLACISTALTMNGVSLYRQHQSIRKYEANSDPYMADYARSQMRGQSFATFVLAACSIVILGRIVLTFRTTLDMIIAAQVVISLVLTIIFVALLQILLWQRRMMARDRLGLAPKPQALRRLYRVTIIVTVGAGIAAACVAALALLTQTL